MTDERLARAVSSWLEDTDTPTPDLNSSVRHAMTHIQRTRQLGRRWSLPSFRRTQASTSTADLTGDYQPTPSPAKNARTHHGHNPTVIGRTSTMLSPVKAITAGALVFAIGGVMLIAQPFQQQAGVPGAATDDGPAAPVEVTGTSVLVGCPDPGTTEDSGIFDRTIGGTCRTDWTFSDERLSGSGTIVANEDNYSDGSGLTLGVHSLNIENDEGGWRMRPGYWLEFPGAPDAFSRQVWVLDGEGEYEGLTAVLLVENLENPHGFIFDSEMLPPPENASLK